MLTVEKIGGTSMTKFGDVLNNIIIGNRKKEDYYNRIFVVSAYGGVTNLLLEHKKTGESGIYKKFVDGDDYNTAMDELLKKLIEINRTFADIKLDQKIANDFIVVRMAAAKNYLNSLEDVLATGYIIKQNILLAAREILSSIGEAHSAFNSVNILQNQGINATFVDLCGFNDSQYITIDERIHNSFTGMDFSKTLPVVTGYTKGTEGIMREFDRGYTEVTFSKIAVEVNADEAVIHKEYHLSSADPNIVGVENSIPVGHTNYNVADQLADLGMEAIHPKAAKPIEKAKINIRIKNTFEPDHPGTLISRDYISAESRVEMVSGSDEVVAIEVHDTSMVGEVGFDLGIMEIFKKNNVSYILKATSANSITQVIWEEDLNPELIKDLDAKYEKVTTEPVAIACILGSNIDKPRILAQAVQAFADNEINIKSISQSLRQVNIQFIFDRNRYREVIQLLNNTLCVSK
ncbi:MAG: aspartate kinase [Bacteroidota bacterium]